MKTQNTEMENFITFIFSVIFSPFSSYARMKYPTIQRSRLKRLQMQNKASKFDIVYVSFGCLILVGLVKQIGESFRRTAPPLAAEIATTVNAISEKNKVVGADKVTEVKYIEVKNDDRTETLKKFLESKKSPLINYAGSIIKESDEHGIPWTLITAISGKESSFGLYYPAGSHNAWGIKFKDKDGSYKIRHFASWEESIAYEAALLGNNYRWNMNKGIQLKYCPTAECNKDWANHVTGFSEDILAAAEK